MSLLFRSSLIAGCLVAFFGASAARAQPAPKSDYTAERKKEDKGGGKLLSVLGSLLGPNVSLQIKGLGDPPPKVDKKARAVAKQIVLAEYLGLKENDKKAAVTELQKAMQTDPANVKAGVMMARFLYDLGDKKKSLTTLEKLLKKQPNEVEVWRGIHVLKKDAGDEQGALAALKKISEINPDDADVHFALCKDAYLKWKAGAPDKDAQKDNALAEAKAYLASTPLKKGMVAQDVERLIVELSASPTELAIFDARRDFDRAFDSRGLINLRMDKARRGFEKCVADQPDNQSCRYYLGMIYGSVKSGDSYDPKKARVELEKATGNVDAQIELGVMLRRTNDLAGATAAFKRALELAPRSARARLELGIVAKVDGRENEAVELFAAAVQADMRSAVGARALDELTKLRPDHQLARLGIMFGPAPADIFSSERFLAAVSLIEKRFGGVQEGAPEEAAVREMVMRLMRAYEVPASKAPKVAVLNSPIVNAMALPNGNVYVTRGMLDDLKKRWPDRAIDANHGPLAHVMAHELAHVVRRHTAQTTLYREAMRESNTPLVPAVLTHTTRLQEIEADRMSIVIAFLAGYDPRGGIEFMEVMGQQSEIPPGLDHPTFDERVHYLEEFWSNDVKHAFLAFKSGVAKMDEAGKMEATAPGDALGLYKNALDDFRRFRDTVQPTKEILNNMGVALAKMGALAQAKGGSPITTWQTPFSVERDTALKFRALALGEKARGEAGPIPYQILQAIEVFKEALSKDPEYRRASLNLATVQIAAGSPGDALEVLKRLPAVAGAEQAETLNVTGVALAEANKAKEAEASFKDALKEQPGQQAAMFNLGRLYKSTKRQADADVAFKAYVAKFPTGVWTDAAKKEITPPPAPPAAPQK